MRIEPPFVVEDDRILVDCYRFKMEITREGWIKVYAYNESKKGDVMVLIKPDSIFLAWEKGCSGEVLRESMEKVVFEKIFESGQGTKIQ